MKQELKEIVGYLPYGVKVSGHGKYISTLRYDTDANDLKGISLKGVLEDWHVKLILRPLSDIEDYFEDLYGRLNHQDVTDYFDSDFLYDNNCLEISDLKNVTVEEMPYGTLKVLLKHHFDIHNLIEQGKAINLNDLEI